MATVVAVQAAQLFGIGLLIVAGLAFLGFGPAEPEPSWGFMIQDASEHIFDAPWLMVPTGVVLALTVVAANELADAIAGKAAAEKPRPPQAAPARCVAPAARPRRPADPERGPRGPRPVRVGRRRPGAGHRRLLLACSQGRVLGLVGESGCGKTMTARSLMGLLPDGVSVSGGSILWQGRELVGLSEKELTAIRGREIAMISQEPMVALDPMFSVAYQLTQPIRRFRGVGRGEARKIAAELLQQVGIVDAERVLKSYPHQLSGGMAQRVCIALALTGEPKLLIADEPTTALDVTVQAEILSLLRALVRDTGLSVVIVSHDLGVVADICDDVAVMYAGEVVESGTAAAVLDDPAHPYTMALLGANPHVPEGEPVPRAAGVDRRHRAAARLLADRLPLRHAAASSPRRSARRRSRPLPAHGDGSVLLHPGRRAARADVTWGAEDVGAEIAPGAEPLRAHRRRAETAPTAGVTS